MQARFIVMAHDGALNVEHLPVGRHDFRMNGICRRQLCRSASVGCTRSARRAGAASMPARPPPP